MDPLRSLRDGFDRTGYWVELDEERLSEACVVRPGRCSGTGGTLTFWVKTGSCMGTILSSQTLQASSFLKIECSPGARGVGCHVCFHNTFQVIKLIKLN